MIPVLATTLAHTAGPGFGFGLFFVLVPLFWLTLLVVLVVLFAVFGRRWRRERFQHPGWSAPTRSAEATVAERYAQGDIDEKEFRARLDVLRANGSPTHPAKA